MILSTALFYVPKPRKQNVNFEQLGIRKQSETRFPDAIRMLTRLLL